MPVHVVPGPECAKRSGRHVFCVPPAVGLLAGLLLLLIVAPAAAQLAPSRYWIFLEDKPGAALGNATAVDNLGISRRAARRRARRGTGDIEWLDRSVSPVYLDSLLRLGIRPVVVSRWLNAVSALLTEAQMHTLEHIDFVSNVREVRRLRTSHSQDDGSEVAQQDAEDPPLGFTAPLLLPPPARGAYGFSSRPLAIDYGESYGQLAMIHAIEPLENGVNGSGVRLGFLDAPFSNLEHPALNHLRETDRLLGIRDIVNRPQGVQSHGLSVVSVAAGFDEGRLVGPAFGAEILGAITEYAPSETNQEEDYFVAGLEWLESMGVDVVNVSLGYTRFDVGEHSYTPADLDGDTAVTTRAADMAASLGVVVVASAGNNGCASPEQCWYYISTPADGDSVIAVAAAREDSTRAPFSSRGPTADGRIKPDVAAPGAGVLVALPGGRYASANGTSFASPLVAGVVCQMLQVNPDLTPADVIQILRQTAGRSEHPDYALGWGVINASAAVRQAHLLRSAPGLPAPPVEVLAYPNPATDHVIIHITAGGASTAEITVYDVLGRRVRTPSTHVLQETGLAVRIPTADLPSGLYVYSIQLGHDRATGHFIVVGP